MRNVIYTSRYPHLLLLIGIVALFINGVQLDIQFKGGAILKYTYHGELDAGRAADIAGTTLNRLVDTQVTQDLASGENRLVLNLSGNAGLDAADQEKLDAALKSTFPDASLSLSESSMVEPFFGRRFLQNGITAIVLASVLIVLYVWISFRKISGLSAGVMALVALLHDMLMVFFACVVFKNTALAIPLWPWHSPSSATPSTTPSWSMTVSAKTPASTGRCPWISL